MYTSLSLDEKICLLMSAVYYLVPSAYFDRLWEIRRAEEREVDCILRLPQELVNVTTAAQIAGMQRVAMQRAIRTGLIPAMVIAGRPLVRRQDALAYRKKTWNKRKPQPPRIG